MNYETGDNVLVKKEKFMIIQDYKDFDKIYHIDFKTQLNPSGIKAHNQIQARVKNENMVEFKDYS